MEELQVVIEQQTENEILVVKDYTNLLNNLVATLSDFNEKHLAICDDIELQEVKEFRTQIRKIKDNIKEYRDAIYSQYVGTFCRQCMELEKTIDNCDKLLKAKVETFTDKDKAKQITLEIKTYDKANADAIVKFAEKLGCVVKVK